MKTIIPSLITGKSEISVPSLGHTPVKNQLKNDTSNNGSIGTKNNASNSASYNLSDNTSDKAVEQLTSMPKPVNMHTQISEVRVDKCRVALSPLQIAIALVSATGFSSAWAVDTPNISAITNTQTDNNKPYQNNLTNSASINTITTPTSANSNNQFAPSAIESENASKIENTSAIDQTYQYELNNQNAEDKISRQLDNQTLTEFNNFAQPVATLKQNKPTIGYNAKIEDATPQSIAQKITTTQPITSNNQSTITQQSIKQPQAEAQVAQQLNEQNNTAEHINHTVSVQANAANQTDNIQSTDAINPNDYLPEYQQQPETLTATKSNSTVTADPQSFVTKLKNKLFNRIQGVNYIDVTFANADANKEPARNIKAALEQVTVDSVSDFNASINKMRQIAKEAAEAVGYYDTKIGFKHLGGDNIQVSLDVGKPVIVQNRVVDIRGSGAEGDNALAVYPVIEKDIPPKVGDVFDHGIYKAAKSTIEGVAQTNGFFDASWLNSSVDIILPDNTADVDLIYDTKDRYHFGDIKVYSIDKQGNLTDDPDKLPIKPKLLKALMTYQKGDAYYQPFVAKFSNNLLATRYFNGIDVDVIMPSNEAANSNLAFNNSQPTTPSRSDNSTTEEATAQPANNQDKAAEKTTIVANDTNHNQQSTNKTAVATSAENALDNNITDVVNKNTNATLASTNQKPTNQVQDPSDIAPLQFSGDDSTQERLNAISKKAENLLKAPEDMELAPETTRNSKNPLVKIANAVSSVAKKLDKKQDLPITPNPGQVIPKLKPEQVYEQKQVPTYVVLNATKPHEAQIGLGYETDVGVRVTGKYNNNLVNRNGLQTGINTSISKVDQAIEITANYPYKDPLTDKLMGSIGYEHKDSTDFINTFKADSIYANIARNIIRDSGWNRIYSLRYRSDKLKLDGQYDTENLPYPFNNYASDYTQQALLAGFALTKTVADNALTPSFGYSQRYSIEIGSNSVLSDTNMAILRAGGTGMYSFGADKKQQVLGRLDLGYMYSGDFYDVPYRSRFFAGGDQSIRGFNTDSLGPTYGNKKFLVGGNALAVGSLEYNYEFRSGLRAAFFTDFGNAYDLEGKYDNTTEVGIGAGVRWKSPIGLVRLDLATGLTDENHGIRLHFFIGSPL